MEFNIEYDGDLWKVTQDGEFVDCFACIAEAAAEVVELAAKNPAPTPARLRQLFVDADSELSAIAHGRPPSDKETLLRLSQSFRDLYEKRIPGANHHDWCANSACPTCTARLAAERAS